MSENEFDYIVVGAGAAGCILAGRLSEDRHRRVLLIEAGPDIPPGQEPDSIRDPYPTSYGEPRFLWPQLTAEVSAQRSNATRSSRHYAQGRIMGGSSSINGMVAVRGHPGDFDEWARLGGTGWSWQDVLPFFKRFERDLDFDDPMHGRDGPIPIRRHARAVWPPFCRVVSESMEERGFAFIPDYNGNFEDGVSAMPMNNLPDGRVSSAMGFLNRAVRGRPNLRILADTHVEILVHDGGRIQGVKARTPTGVVTFCGRETIVSAGALHSPALLMRSGIGAANTLRELGIAVVANLPGVGANLHNHPRITVAAHLPVAAMQPRRLRSFGFSCLRYSSGQPDCPASDMFMCPVNQSAWHPLGRRIGALGVFVAKSFSRGVVSLRSADPQQEPMVRMNLLSDERDMQRMIAGIGFCLNILGDERVAAVRNEVFMPNAAVATRLNRPGLRSWLQSYALALLMDGPKPIRRRLLGPHIIDPLKVAKDENALREIVLQHATPVHHVCGTCKIGPADDGMSVLDARCRVHGLEGLRVVDASIMPTIVRANTHLAVLMIGEKGADMIRADNS